MTSTNNRDSNPATRRISLQWEVGHAATAAAAPGRWVAAVVPGAVQLDWARAEGWPEYWKGDNCKAYQWMEDVWWTYRTSIPSGIPVAADQRLVFACGGVDYHFTVVLNGVLLHEQEGMFAPFELDLTDRARAGGLLEVRLRPAPKAPAAADDRRQARLCAKPAVAYGWDWHPRLIPLGIWEDAVLEIRPASRLLDGEMRYTLDPEVRRAAVEIAVEATAAAEGNAWRWRLHSPQGQLVAEGGGRLAGARATASATMDGLELWWPHDHGAQPLYLASFELLDSAGRVLDCRTQQVGFRRVRLVMHEGAWEEPADLPRSRSHPPITLEINGRAIFARGANWVPPEIFPGVITAGTYRPLLALARGAHFNLLRSWGGGIVNKESFFDQCDELGLLVWQEFPLACNNYEDDPGYLRVLDAESRAIIRRVRRHACLAIWSGGNELFNSWSGMTDQHLALRLLNRNCYDLDPTTPFIPTSPLDGMGHGDYRFRNDEGLEVHQVFANSRKTAYPEFGCPGPSPAEYLRRFIPAGELWPPRPGTAWETHHGFMAWVPPSESSWLFPEIIEHYFGPSASLEQLVAGGSWLQCEGYKVNYEEARRQKPKCSMALNWCYNEPWPSAANNNIVNWPAEPKPAYHAVAAACRPVMASARIPKFTWSPGEEFTAEVWLLNDSPAEVPAGRISVEVACGDRVIHVLDWQHSAAAAGRNVRGPGILCVLPAGSDRFTLRLRSEGAPERDSEYPLPFRRTRP